MKPIAGQIPQNDMQVKPFFFFQVPCIAVFDRRGLHTVEYTNIQSCMFM